MRGGSGQSIHHIPFALSVLIGKISPAQEGVSVNKHKLSPALHQQHKGHKCFIDIILIVEPGQISFKYGV